MDVHKPKPMHGWRDFLKEIGSIVLGVSIALAAEQGVEWLHWKSEVAEARRALNQEVADNLGGYRDRLRRGACIENRLAELNQWWLSWRQGHPVQLTGPIGRPTSVTLGTAIWDTASSSTAAKMPFEERTAYAVLYTRFRNYENIRMEERQAWSELGDYDQATRLDDTALMRLKGIITRLKWHDERVKANTPYVFPVAQKLGIMPNDNVHITMRWDTELCRPILPRP